MRAPNLALYALAAIAATDSQLLIAQAGAAAAPEDSLPGDRAQPQPTSPPSTSSATPTAADATAPPQFSPQNSGRQPLSAVLNPFKPLAQGILPNLRQTAESSSQAEVAESAVNDTLKAQILQLAEDGSIRQARRRVPTLPAEQQPSVLAQIEALANQAAAGTEAAPKPDSTPDPKAESTAEADAPPPETVAPAPVAASEPSQSEPAQPAADISTDASKPPEASAAPVAAAPTPPASTKATAPPTTPQQRLRSSGMIFPIAGQAPVTSGFGWRIHPISGNRRFHSGTDFGAAHGTPVLAAQSGRVTHTGRRGGYGIIVEIEHQEGLVDTLYAHLSDTYVSPGDWVEQGTPIGAVGSTGAATGPHLHFEIRHLTSEGSVAVDPVPHLQQGVYAQAPTASPPRPAPPDRGASRPRPSAGPARPYSVVQVADLKISAIPASGRAAAKPELSPQSSGAAPAASTPVATEAAASARPELPAQQRFNNLDIQDFDYWSNLCQSLVNSQEYVDAVAACDRALALKADDLDTWLYRGRALEAQGLYTEAVASYGYVLSRESRHAEALVYQCRAFAQMGNYPAALAACEQALSVNRRWGALSAAAAWHQRGQVLAQMADYEAAIAAYDRSLRLEPDQPQVLVDQGWAWLDLEQPQAALNTSTEALELAADAPSQALRLQGQALVQLDRLEAAIAAYDKALAAEMDNAELWTEQAQLLSELGRHQDALTAFTQAVQLQPQASSTLLAQAATLNHLGQYEPALQAIEQATQGDQNWADHQTPAFIWNQRAQALSGLGDHQAALAAANRAIGFAPDYAPAWNNHAVILWHLEDFAQALTSIRQATTIDGSYAQAWFNQGRILSSMQQYSDALAAYDEAIGRDPSPPAEVWLNRGVVLWHLDQFERALQSVEKALQIEPNAYQARVNQGIILLSMGRYEAAIEAYDQATAINPNGAEAWYGKGNALSNLNREEAASAAYAQAANLGGAATMTVADTAPTPVQTNLN